MQLPCTATVHRSLFQEKENLCGITHAPLDIDLTPNGRGWEMCNKVCMITVQNSVNNSVSNFYTGFTSLTLDSKSDHPVVVLACNHQVSGSDGSYHHNHEELYLLS